MHQALGIILLLGLVCLDSRDLPFRHDGEEGGCGESEKERKEVGQNAW